jgi:hypothetical protein
VVPAKAAAKSLAPPAMQAIFPLMTERKEKAGPAPQPDAPGPDAPKPDPPKPGEPKPQQKAPVEEIGGRKGPDPTRYGDWEVNGRCVDF